MKKEGTNQPKVVIIGGGFGGLEAAKALTNEPIDVTLVDKKNHHTFQPLLYQVATAVLSPGQIASPIRRILRRASNVEVLLGEATGFDLDKGTVLLKDDLSIDFDYLIVAAGARHAYFGHDEWEDDAPGLKTIEDALEIRRRVLLAFELAERDAMRKGTHEPLNFVVIGGGATGVELAGAIAGIARQALAKDFKAIDTRTAKVMLLEGADRILNSYSEKLSDRAKRDLEDLGVEVRLGEFVTDIRPGEVKVGDEWIDSSVVVWASGVAASPLGAMLGAETDRAGRVLVEDDLSVKARPNVFVIGDMARVENEDGSLVPGVAPAAMQMAWSAAKNILGDIRGEARTPFKYKDKGSMATIGRNKAIVERGWFKMSGFLAWMAWLVLHIVMLIGFRNRLFVLSEWIWAYFTRERTARLITGDAEDLKDALQFITAEPGHSRREKARRSKVA
ncbi:MAG: NAD(P)/FAD-dependent oxidoreductase [Aridibacter famidurans]|nr:NAD(P)/FAD-dependent oxidoreductase [Aridibacter famidurans]